MTDDLRAKLAADLAGLASEPTDDERRRVTDLALRAREEEVAVVRATAALRAALDAYTRTIEQDLPAALTEIGQSEFRLIDKDRTPVKLKSELRSGWLRDDGENANPEGLAWVEAQIADGGRALVRATITAEFDAEDIEDAKEIYEMIRRHPAANRLKSLKFSRLVLGNSLIKWVGELIDQLKDPPLELLRIWRRTWVQVGTRRPKTIKLTGFER